MHREIKSKVDQVLLRKINQAFGIFRRRGKGGRLGYPPELRRLTVMAVKSGSTAAVVARSAGVSEQSLCNWLNEDRQNPQELLIVPEPTASSPQSSFDVRTSSMARFHLRSGILIEVPIEALTPSLMGVLNQGGHAV